MSAHFLSPDPEGPAKSRQQPQKGTTGLRPGTDAQANPWLARRRYPGFLLLALLIVPLSFLISHVHPSLGQRSVLHIHPCKTSSF